VEVGTSVLVLPRWVPLSTCCFALDGALPGDQPGHLRGEAPPAIAGVRAYQPGDSMARIHWTASARAGMLLTKQFDPEVQTTVWLALDLDGTVPEEAEELLVTAATSLGMYALQQAQLRVGLVASGAYPATLLPERGRGQQQRLQELLAEVHPGQNAMLVEHFAQMDRHVSAKQVVILLTTRAPSEWTGWLEQLHHRGLVGRVVHVPPQGLAAQAGDGWPVPAVSLPLTLADPTHGEELVAYLEQGGADLAL
jgi:uncharacterized protein (DUF58 family)